MAGIELSEVHAGVWELRLPIPWEDGRINCFLLPDGNQVDMIDCGMSSEESSSHIREALRTLAGPGARVRRLVVTHIHPDHYGGAGEMIDTGAELMLHRLEVPMVHPRYLEIEQLVTEVGEYLRVHGVPEEAGEAIKNASRGMREFVRPAPPDLQLDGSEMVRMGTRELRVEWTPGHSPGHVCLWDPRARILFGGDQLLPDATANIGLHPQSTPDPLDDFVRGLRRIGELAPALVLPAHGRPFTAAQPRIDELLAHHVRRKEQIVALIGSDDLSAWRVATRVWGVRESLIEMRMALQEGLAHLQSLSREGRLEKRATPAAITWRRPPAA